MPDDRSDADPYARISAGDAHRFLFERVADDTRCRVYDLDGRLVATLVGYLYGDGLPDAFDFTVTNPPVLPAGPVPEPYQEPDPQRLPASGPFVYAAVSVGDPDAHTTSPDFGHDRERPFVHAHLHQHATGKRVLHDHPHPHGVREKLRGVIRGGDHHPASDPYPDPDPDPDPDGAP